MTCLSQFLSETGWWYSQSTLFCGFGCGYCVLIFCLFCFDCYFLACGTSILVRWAYAFLEVYIYAIYTFCTVSEANFSIAVGLLGLEWSLPLHFGLVNSQWKLSCWLGCRANQQRWPLKSHFRSVGLFLRHRVLFWIVQCTIFLKAFMNFNWTPTLQFADFWLDVFNCGFAPFRIILVVTIQWLIQWLARLPFIKHFLDAWALAFFLQIVSFSVIFILNFLLFLHIRKLIQIVVGRLSRLTECDMQIVWL